jgi:hypothetical protein
MVVPRYDPSGLPSLPPPLIDHEPVLAARIFTDNAEHALLEALRLVKCPLTGWSDQKARTAKAAN